MSAEELSAITGLPTAEAESFLEMAGGSLEAAVSLFFSMNEGGGAPDVAMEGSGVTFVPPSPAHAVLFGDEPAPASWLDQGFEFSSDATSACGIVQHKNGPCGVLAAVNAIIVAQAGCPSPTVNLSGDEPLCKALATILVRCAKPAIAAVDTEAAEGSGSIDRIVVASWIDGIAGGSVLETELPTDEAAVVSHLLTCAQAFRGAGGVNLLCYSAVLTRGIDRVRADAALDGSRQPLILGPHALCGTELMGLLLCGVARGNVSAYDNSESGNKVKWRMRGDVGFLSCDEVEIGVPLADELKGPSKPVYICHGGDHFTILWAPTDLASEGAVEVVHWNGLPPNRAMVRLRIRNGSLEPPPPAPEIHQQTHWRAKIGEVESVVQARPTDKQDRPGCWRTWAYELALVTQAVVDDDRSEERPEHLPAPPSFEQGPLPVEGEAWRCLSCYQTRFKTMCFGENGAPASTTCKFCSLPQGTAGWTIWRKYEELPPALQRRIDRTSGPKILTVLRTRWPEAELSLFNVSGAEVPLGGTGFDPKECVVPVA